ncbi:hypothetical protein WMY93_028350 [Mugilogobius chulae]|uniref:Uncharacterized protein n=1 Tax=Mugilogobius chulae TaxID=88201 RepID=A0AAW0MZV6_9GOBI
METPEGSCRSFGSWRRIKMNYTIIPDLTAARQQRKQAQRLHLVVMTRTELHRRKREAPAAWVRAAERTIGASLPQLQEIYRSRLEKKALNIYKDRSHPGHGLFTALPSGKRFIHCDTS